MGAQRAIVAVLAGGSATRLGGDGKAALELGGRPLIARPLQAAHDAGLETLVVAKRGSALPPLRARVLHEPQRPRHPLCGVVAALRFLDAERPHAEALLAVGCDMPFLRAELLAWLAGLDGAVLARVAGRDQPLLARWPVEALAPLSRALRERLSLRAALAQLAPRIVDERELARFGDPRALCFSVNDHADLATARRRLDAESSR
jgi:molybdopterin-guanine dinucleotide biosynthesis protein A